MKKEKNAPRARNRAMRRSERTYDVHEQAKSVVTTPSGIIFFFMAEPCTVWYMAERRGYSSLHPDKSGFVRAVSTSSSVALLLDFGLLVEPCGFKSPFSTRTSLYPTRGHRLALLAERRGFEPLVRLLVHTLSKRDRSTAPAPLHIWRTWGDCNDMDFFVKKFDKRGCFHRIRADFCAYFPYEQTNHLKRNNPCCPCARYLG